MHFKPFGGIRLVGERVRQNAHFVKAVSQQPEYGLAVTLYGIGESRPFGVGRQQGVEDAALPLQCLDEFVVNGLRISGDVHQ